MFKKFKILIVDDNESQYHIIVQNILKFDDSINNELRYKIANELLDIEYCKSPSEAENLLINSSKGRNKYDILICDMNFENGAIPEDNGHYRGVNVIIKALEHIPDICVFLISLFEMSDILHLITEKLPAKHYSRWMFKIDKERIRTIWSANFNQYIQNYISDNFNEIILKEEQKQRFSNQIKNKININLEEIVEFKNSKWHLKNLFLGFLRFGHNNDSYKIIPEKDFNTAMESLTKHTSKKNNELLIKFFTEFEKHHKFERVWKREIYDFVEAQKNTFMSLTKEETFNNLEEFYKLKIGKFLDMRYLNYEAGIEDEANQFLFINWLKARLLVITLNQLLINNIDSFRQKGYDDIIINNNISFVILVILKRDIATFNILVAPNPNSKREQVKQYFYTYLKLKGSLKPSTTQDNLNTEDEDYLLQHEIKWLRQNGLYQK